MYQGLGKASPKRRGLAGGVTLRSQWEGFLRDQQGQGRDTGTACHVEGPGSSSGCPWYRMRCRSLGRWAAEGRLRGPMRTWEGHPEQQGHHSTGAGLSSRREFLSRETWLGLCYRKIPRGLGQGGGGWSLGEGELRLNKT